MIMTVGGTRLKLDAIDWTSHRNGSGFAQSRSAATASGVQDQTGDLVRTRDQRQMTGHNLDRLGLYDLET
jgi:hypothetical protein